MDNFPIFCNVCIKNPWVLENFLKTFIPPLWKQFIEDFLKGLLQKVYEESLDEFLVEFLEKLLMKFNEDLMK